MNILITGGCGFIASNFINYYFNANPDSKIINLDAMYYCASESNVSEEIRKSSRYQFVKGNLCSTDLVNYILHNHNIDTVIHFAAQSHVQNSFSDSLQYTQDNVLGTHTLLEVCRLYGKIKKFIHISTDEVYGESMIQENEEKNKKLAHENLDNLKARNNIKLKAKKTNKALSVCVNEQDQIEINGIKIFREFLNVDKQLIRFHANKSI